MELKTDVSVGEILDKISVLKVKAQRISDKAKLKEVHKELEVLTKLCDENLKDYTPWVEELKKVNEEIWDLIDKQWAFEKKNQYDSRCIELSRSVILVNDKRFQIKKKINEFYGSNIKEVKSFD